MTTFQWWMYALGTTAGAVVGYLVGAADLGVGVLLLVLGIAIVPSLFWPREGQFRQSATTRQNAEEVLHALSEEQIAGILATIRQGHKIQAIKELRAICSDGLKEAKNAVELLEARGENWKDSAAS